MSYTPHTWVDQETITAAKLNNIEEGIDEASQSGSGGLLVETTFIDDGQYDVYFKTTTTANEIIAQYIAGGHVVIHSPGAENYSEPERYISLQGYEPANQETNHDEKFYPEYIGNLTGITRTNDGYLKLDIYVD